MQTVATKTWANDPDRTPLIAIPAWPDLPASKPTFIAQAEIAKRYPFLTAMVQDVLIGSVSEAACCIHSYRMGLRHGSEAVSHSGLSPYDRIKDAARRGTWMRKDYREGYRALLNRGAALRDAERTRRTVIQELTLEGSRTDG